LTSAADVDLAIGGPGLNVRFDFHVFPFLEKLMLIAARTAAYLYRRKRHAKLLAGRIF